MWSPVRLNDGTTYGYGFGWFVGDLQGRKWIHHSGGVPGFVCEFDRFVDDGLTVVLMVNTGNRDLSDMAVSVAGLYAPALKPAAEKPVHDSEPQVTGRVKAVVANLAQGVLEPDAFSSEMRSQLESELKGSAFKVLRAFGPIQAFRLIERKQNGENRIYSYRLIYRNIGLFVDCTLDKADRITRFGLHD